MHGACYAEAQRKAKHFAGTDYTRIATCPKVGWVDCTIPAGIGGGIGFRNFEFETKVCGGRGSASMLCCTVTTGISASFEGSSTFSSAPSAAVITLGMDGNPPKTGAGWKAVGAETKPNLISCF